MSTTTKKEEPQYDVILVGSGTGNATLAKELSIRGRRVLLLEQGRANPLGDGFLKVASIVREVRIGEDMRATTAITLGGSTALYFGVCKWPDLDGFRRRGIDLGEELEEVRRELPSARPGERFLPEQSRRFAAAAQTLGYTLKYNDLLIDTGRCPDYRYRYEAKWRARDFVEQAKLGAGTVLTGARVTRVLQRDGCAIGVEYEIRKGVLGRRMERVFARDVVLGGGAFSTPLLLREAGIESVGRQGFFCKPGYMVCGLGDEMNGEDAFVGSLDLEYHDGVSLGDGTMNRSLFRLAMLANGRLRQAFSHRRILSAGVLLDDSLGGELDTDGNYRKSLTEDEQLRLETAGKDAARILKKAGASGIFRTKMVGGLPGGSVRFGEHLNADLQTRIANLYVCDHSLLFDSSATPTVPLVCLGKYLAKHLDRKYRSTDSTNPGIAKSDNAVPAAETNIH